MKGCCENPRPDEEVAQCGCKDEICFHCGQLTILFVCDEHMKQHFGE